MVREKAGSGQGDSGVWFKTEDPPLKTLSRGESVL